METISQKKQQSLRYIIDFKNMHFNYADSFKAYLFENKAKLNFYPILENEKLSKKLEKLFEDFKAENKSLIRSYLKVSYNSVYIVLRNDFNISDYTQYIDTQICIFWNNKYNSEKYENISDMYLFEKSDTQYNFNTALKSIEKINLIDEKIKQLNKQISDLKSNIPHDFKF